MNNSKNEILMAALALAQKGRQVLPVGRDKKPLLKDWPHLASTGEDQIRQWFDRAHPPNLALVTGQPSGFFALDVDGPPGRASLEGFEGQYSRLAREDQAMAQTPSAGLHFYFQMPAFDLRNSAGALGAGLDIRGNGGYVLVPPSKAVNREGQLRSYQWVNSDLTLARGDLPPAPAWLLNLLEGQASSPAPPPALHPAPRPAPPGLGTTAYGRKALEEECRRLSLAAQGSRNDTLNRAAFAVFQLVSGGEIEQSLALARLSASALATGLPAREVEATLQSAARRGLAEPRSVQPGSTQPGSTQPASVQPASVQPVVRPASPGAVQGYPAIYRPQSEVPLDVFPPKIQKLLKESALAFKHLPIEVPLVAFLALLSGCVGQSRAVEVKPGWEEAGNLYIVMVADSGVGKSHCFKAMLHPIWRQDLAKKSKWESEMASYNESLEARKQNKDLAAQEPLPDKPVRTQYIIEDATTEAIGSMLSENPRGLLWYCDELSSIILNLDRYANAKGGAKARLLSTYDGSPWKTSRRDGDKEQSVASAVLSIAGTVQPKILRELFSQYDALSGFLPRFIFIRAERDRPALLTHEIFTGQEILEKIAGHLLSWELRPDSGQLRPQKVRLTVESYKLYEEWHNQVMREAWLESDNDSAIAPKLVTQVIRLALLLHSLNAALEGTDGLADIGPETMGQALKLGGWIRAQQRQIWQSMNISTSEAAAPLEAAIIQTAVELEDFCKTHEWKIVNDQFNRLVAEKLGQPVDSGQIGKAAARLGLKSVILGKKRGKELSPELLNNLKAGFSCRPVGDEKSHDFKVVNQPGL